MVILQGKTVLELWAVIPRRAQNLPDCIAILLWFLLMGETKSSDVDLHRVQLRMEVKPIPMIAPVAPRYVLRQLDDCVGNRSTSAPTDRLAVIQTQQPSIQAIARVVKDRVRLYRGGCAMLQQILV